MSLPAPGAQDEASAALMGLITGYMPSRVVHVAAQLGIADLLSDGPKLTDALALETRTDEPSLRRLLRALSSVGVLEECEPGKFGLTAMGAQLRANVSGSVRNQALMYGGERSWNSWGELLRSVQTGEPGVRHVYGVGSFEYLAANPDQAVIFNNAMAEITARVAQALISAFDFSQCRTVIDVGGGNGAMIAAIVGATQKTRGIVFDLPAVCAEASRALADTSLGAKCEVISGDFFREVPKAADTYILKSVIHDWSDEAGVAILKNCRTAMDEKGRLLLVERVMPEQIKCVPDQQRMAMLDMNMLAITGGRERTEAEYRLLLAGAGFILTRISTLPGLDVSLIEADPKP